MKPLTTHCVKYLGSKKKLEEFISGDLFPFGLEQDGQPGIRFEINQIESQTSELVVCTVKANQNWQDFEQGKSYPCHIRKSSSQEGLFVFSIQLTAK